MGQPRERRGRGPQRLKTRRPRRLSIATKQALAKEVADSPHIRKKSQHIASTRIVKAKLGLDSPVSPKSVSKFSKATMFQYLLKGRELYTKARHVSMVADAGRIAGDSLEVIGVYNCEMDRCFWSPPQVVLWAGGGRFAVFGAGLGRIMGGGVGDFWAEIPPKFGQTNPEAIGFGDV